MYLFSDTPVPFAFFQEGMIGMDPIGFTDFLTSSGTPIRVYHEMNMGDLMICILLALQLGQGAYKWITEKIWGGK